MTPFAASKRCTERSAPAGSWLPGMAFSAMAMAANRPSCENATDLGFIVMPVPSKQVRSLVAHATSPLPCNRARRFP